VHTEFWFEGNGPLGGYRRKMTCSIKMDVKEIKCEIIYYIIQVKLLALLDTGMKLGVGLTAGNFLTI